jgi:hypothetical protein
MITFKLTKPNFSRNTFIAKKKTPISNTLNSFGYIKIINSNFHSKHYATVYWYDNFIKSELTFSYKELEDNYKSIYPYYNTKFVRGNIWKYSYETLLAKIHKDMGFCNIKVDKMTYKKVPIKGNNVIIMDAVYVLSNGITKLQGVIEKIIKNTYTIHTEEGNFTMSRCSFVLLPQDYFILLSIRCN